MSKFKIGDKVIPISKILDNAYGGLYGSSTGKAIRDGRVKFLYLVNIAVVENNKNVHCCSEFPNGGGDYYLEEDLIFYNDIKTGDKIRVKMHNEDKWGERIYIATLPNGSALCVEFNHEHRFFTHNQFQTFSWPIFEPMPDFIPVQVKLNNEHTATIYKDKVVVGCQSFSFDPLLEIFETIQEIKKNKI